MKRPFLVHKNKNIDIVIILNDFEISRIPYIEISLFKYPYVYSLYTNVFLGGEDYCKVVLKNYVIN